MKSVDTKLTEHSSGLAGKQAGKPAPLPAGIPNHGDEPRLPGAVIVGLILAVVLDTIIQLTWKVAAASVPRDASLAIATVGVLASPFFYAAMLAFGAQLWNWLRVLARADLSFAQPFTALSYITVLGLSSRWLHEHVSPTKGVGVSLILVGVFFISRTPFRTDHPDGPEPQAVDPMHS